MTWAKGHARQLSVLAFCLLALVAELSGRALIASVDIVFAVLAVLLAVLWQAVQQWLAEYEQFAAAVAEQARRFIAAAALEQSHTVAPVLTPRRLYGLAFEVRPPPLPA